MTKHMVDHIWVHDDYHRYYMDEQNFFICSICKSRVGVYRNPTPYQGILEYPSYYDMYKVGVPENCAGITPKKKKKK